MHCGAHRDACWFTRLLCHAAMGRCGRYTPPVDCPVSEDVFSLLNDHRRSWTPVDHFPTGNARSAASLSVLQSKCTTSGIDFVPDSALDQGLQPGFSMASGLTQLGILCCQYRLARHNDARRRPIRQAARDMSRLPRPKQNEGRC